MSSTHYMQTKEPFPSLLRYFTQQLWTFHRCCTSHRSSKEHKEMSCSFNGGIVNIYTTTR